VEAILGEVGLGETEEGGKKKARKK